MGWLEFKWWIRDNITDPILYVVEEKVNSAGQAVITKVDEIGKTGDEVIDAVFDPVGTAGKAVDWVKEHPLETIGFVATVAATATGMKVGRRSVIPGLIEGPNKIGGGHDHRFNKGKDRTPKQRRGDKARRKH